MSNFKEFGFDGVLQMGVLPENEPQLKALIFGNFRSSY